MSDTSSRSFVVGSEGLRVGRVLGKSLTILFGNFAKYIPFGAVIALPDLLFILENGGNPTDIDMVRGHATGASWGTTVVIGIVLLAVCQSSMIHGAFQDIRGKPFDIGVSIRHGLRRFLPVIGTVICAVAVVSIGLILLIVPGIIALMMYFVVIPVCVVENLGPIRSLQRSSELTPGHRWRLLGIYIVMALVIGAGNYLLTRVGWSVAGTAGAALMGFVVQAIGGSYKAIVSIVTYHDLRSVKEGIDIEQLAAVFD